MSRLTRDGTAKPVSRDRILRRERGQGNVHFPCSADHEQNSRLYRVDPYSAICDDHTYIHTWYIHQEGPSLSSTLKLGRSRAQSSTCSWRLSVVRRESTSSILLRYPIDISPCNNQAFVHGDDATGRLARRYYRCGVRLPSRVRR